MKSAEDLVQKFEGRTGSVGIVGLGYVGLPLAKAFIGAGLSVVGVDTDAGKVSKLMVSCRSYIDDLLDVEIEEMVGSNLFHATTSFEDLSGVDAIVICVPTPVTVHKIPDLSYLLSAVDSIAAVGVRGKLVSVESTTFPGTTTEIILPRFDRLRYGHGRMGVGEDFFLAYSPERVDPGSKEYSVINTPKLVSGVTDDCLTVALALYRLIVPAISVSDVRVAEIAKIFENTFRTVNIAFVNEFRKICDLMGIDANEVIDAAGTKPFGFMPFRPGPGVGGHCIPVDPYYLRWKLDSLGYTSRFIDLAMEVNDSMPSYTVGRVEKALAEQRLRKLEQAEILVLGVAYKPDVSDVRESPSIEIVKQLLIRGAFVSYHDFYVPEIEIRGHVMESVDLTLDAVQKADCIVIATDHSGYDFQWIAQYAPVIVDTRNVIGAKREFWMGAWLSE